MSNKKAIPLDLTSDVVYSYDQTKTTALGRSLKKTLSVPQGGKTVVGSPLNVFTDVLNDTLPTAFSGVRGCVSNNGHELLFNTSTAAGVVFCALYDVDEATGIKTYVGKISFQLPSTTHTQRFARLVNDSGATGWRILFGSIGTVASNGGLFSIENIAKADFVQGIPALIPVATAPGQKAVYWHQETGGTNLLTVMQGGGHDHDAGLVTQNIYIANGLVATPNFYVFDSSVAITTVGVGGVTTDWYTSAKTGVVTGLSGTQLLLNNYSVCVPTADSGAPVSHQGATCLFIPAATTMSLVKVSDILPGVTTFPSYTQRDVLDAPNTNAVITIASMHFSNTLQRIVMQGAGTFVVKKFVNGAYELVFGSAGNSQYRALQTVPFYEFGALVVVSTHEHGGWITIMSNSVGQNGVLSFDLRSQWQQDYSAIISKVIDVPNGQFLTLSLQTPIRSFGYFLYRLSGFGSATGGWLQIPEDRDMTSIINSTGQIQLKFQPRMERDSVTVPIQIIEAHLIVDDSYQSDDRWLLSKKDSIDTSPARVAFAQQQSYSGSKHWEVLTYVRSTGTLFSQSNTQTTPSDFELSTDNGTSFNPVVGAIASSPLLNVLAYKFSSPPGIELVSVIREKV